MGWVMLAALGVAAAAALWALGVPRLAWTSVGAALVLAATGYALQGRPDLPEHLATPAAAATAIEPDEAEMRDQMFGAYHNGTEYLGAADALLRAGEARTAARALLGGTQAHPDNIALWTALGRALAASDGDTLSPAATYAFNRAMALAPTHPGPHYFLGVALIAAGQGQAALAQLQIALRLASADAPYRAKLEERVKLLRQFLQMPLGR